MDPFSAIDKWLLRHIYVGMPWRFFNRYVGTIIRDGMNMELGFTGEELDQLSRKEMKETASILKERNIGLTVHAPFWDLCPGSIDPLIRKITNRRYHQVMEAAEVLEPRQVLFHTGFDPRHHREHEEDFIGRAMEIWKQLVKRAENMAIDIVFENVWEEGPHFHRVILNQLASPACGVCLDLGHQNCFSKTPLKEWLENLLPFLKEVHIHDNDGQEDAHAPVGAGTVNFRMFFDFLRQKEVFPVLTVEPHRKDHFFETLKNLQHFISEDYRGMYSKSKALDKNGSRH